jgi:hypothetical protein
MQLPRALIAAALAGSGAFVIAGATLGDTKGGGDGDDVVPSYSIRCEAVDLTFTIPEFAGWEVEAVSAVADGCDVHLATPAGIDFDSPPRLSVRALELAREQGPPPRLRCRRPVSKGALRARKCWDTTHYRPGYNPPADFWNVLVVSQRRRAVVIAIGSHSREHGFDRDALADRVLATAKLANPHPYRLAAAQDAYPLAEGARHRQSDRALLPVALAYLRGRGLDPGLFYAAPAQTTSNGEKRLPLWHEAALASPPRPGSGGESRTLVFDTSGKRVLRELGWQ